jgi:MFS family permease
VILSPALAALIYGLTQIGQQGGFLRTGVIVPMAAGTLLLAAFIARALRTANPLVDLRLFRIRSFAASCALLFSSGLALYGSLLLLPIFFQQLRGETVIATGLLLVPQGFGSLLARPVGALTDRTGPRPIIFGGLTLAALAALAFSFAGTHTPISVLSVILVVLGFGISSTNMAVMVGAYRDLNAQEIPHASSATRVVQQLGGAFGAAVTAVVLQHQLATHPAAQQAHAFSHTFWWIAAFAVVAIIPALLLPRPRPPRTPDGQPTPQRPQRLPVTQARSGYR